MPPSILGIGDKTESRLQATYKLETYTEMPVSSYTVCCQDHWFSYSPGGLVKIQIDGPSAQNF